MAIPANKMFKKGTYKIPRKSNNIGKLARGERTSGVLRKNKQIINGNKSDRIYGKMHELAPDTGNGSPFPTNVNVFHTLKALALVWRGSEP